jgi:hypothetical protein
MNGPARRRRPAFAASQYLVRAKGRDDIAN